MENNIQIKKRYDNVIAYGIGQNYTRLVNKMNIKIDYVMDKRWESTSDKEYNGISIVRQKQLKNMENTLVIVFPENKDVYYYVKGELNYSNVEIVRICELFQINTLITGTELKDTNSDFYEDDNGNKIFFESTVSEKIKIKFNGYNSMVRIGKDINIINHLNISVGNNSICTIGDGTSVGDAELTISDSKLIIGQDCMISNDVIIRTDDGHHFFDAISKQRLNYAKDVIVGDKVWIGQRVALLPGAMIGNGSILGYGAVTSSQFGENKLVVGCPARVIRENVIWSRDNTCWFNRDTFEECNDQSALDYYNLK